MDEAHIDEFEEYVDIVQIGARNMQNFQLLKAVGKMHKPILLKRGLANTIEEWIMSAEYIMAGGNENVILCERGIRTFERATRNTLDLSAVPVIKERPTSPSSLTPTTPPVILASTSRKHGPGHRGCRCRRPGDRGARQPAVRLERRCPVPEA